MEFRLMYQGALPSAGGKDTRADYKHQIRKQLHGQLARLWRTNRHLKSWIDSKQVESIADNYSRCGFRFVPLVRESQGIIDCGLDILFLRRDAPGKIVSSGGDLDNRIKVLFDGLRMPDSCSGLGSPEPHENPFYCLLQDDKLITDVRVTTDVLLHPPQESEHVNDVVLIIRVSVKSDEPEPWTFRD